MTDKEKLLKLKKLADAMYYAAQYLTTDASHLHKAMDEYHQFIIHEYHKEEPTIPDIVDEHWWEMLGEEPVNEDLEKAIDKYLDNGMALRLDWKQCDITFKASRLIKFANYIAQWQKQQMLAKAFEFTKEHNTACILASECLRNHGWFSRERVFNDLFRHLACVDKLFEGKFSGKTKVIVIKED